MKKTISFMIAIIIFVIIVIIYNNILNNNIQNSKQNLYYMIDDVKFNTIEAAKYCLKNDSILVLGSSELSTFNKELFNDGYSNFNMYLVGRGYTQSFQSTLTLGAIENETKIKKVVLILSPQWFEKSGKLTSEIFASRFQKNTFDSFMKNKKISYKTKKIIIEKLKTLEVSDSMVVDKINKYENSYLNHNIIDNIYLNITNNITGTKQKIKLIKLLNENEQSGDNNKIVKFEDYDFEELIEKAQKQGELACTNNDFGIDDEYYNTYIKEKFDINKDTKKDEEFSNKDEYENLEMFLSVCNQLDIEPLLVNVPVNGLWYDYTGCTKEKREVYYDKIRNIANKYGAKISDFSSSEYEKYFLKDIMHLGWKGWIKVDEAIYKFYNEK